MLSLKDFPCIESVTDIREICKPLQKLGINYFNYVKINKNTNNRILFGTDADWLLHYYDKKYYEINFFERFSIEDYRNRYYIWDLMKDTDSAIIPKDAKDNFNYDHGLTIVHKTIDTIILYEFTAPQGNWFVNNLYLHSLEIFEKFIHYFNEKAASLLRKHEKQKIILPPNREKIINSNGQLAKYELMMPMAIREFNSLVKPKKYYFDESKGEYFTNREYDCLQLISQGKTSKEVALALGLSHRTVESYIDKAKNRLCCAHTSALIELYLSVFPISN